MKKCASTSGTEPFRSIKFDSVENTPKPILMHRKLIGLPIEFNDKGFTPAEVKKELSPNHLKIVVETL